MVARPRAGAGGGAAGGAVEMPSRGGERGGGGAEGVKTSPRLGHSTSSDYHQEAQEPTWWVCGSRAGHTRYHSDR